MEYDLYIHHSNVQNGLEEVYEKISQKHIKVTDFSVEMEEFIDNCSFLCIGYPFDVIDEDDLVKTIMDKNKQNSDTKVILPMDTEAIYCLNLSNLHDYELVYSKGSLSFQQLANRCDKVATIQTEEDVGERVLVLIRNVMAFINHFNPTIPRLYEMKLNNGELEERELRLKQPVFSTSSERIAILVHGFLSASERNFEALKRELLERKHYDKVIGYSYATTEASIVQHGERLYETLNHTGIIQKERRVDFYAHSLGGLITRSMINHDGYQASSYTNNMVLAGVPHLGTPLAEYGDQLLSEEGWSMAELLFHIVRDLIQVGQEALPIYEDFLVEVAMFQSGTPVLRDMSPDSAFIRELNETRHHVSGQVFLIGYSIPEEKQGDSFFSKQYRDLLHNLQIFDTSNHDGVVPNKSSCYKFQGYPQPIVIPNLKPGWHTWYFNEKERAKYILDTILHSY
ncbi:esterase/lipase family protein [Pontibacillus yanchengensis]|uniref:DUF7379 domain-containing protein n=1 Tax=Pontibacillus yanchengensis Y32 TaxID=1385514 RepID=A0A0A2T5R6_9BACI|nr:hypothetical protein [Pontibacillus yanchengensis]KGP71147.1 hypothetical protein N782_21675 [Pontibacillus yanchengensis Y32]